MNPLAAALLAAQGWDVSRLRKQSPNIERGSPSNEGSNTKPNSGLDINALLNNPAILQALNKQLTTSAVTNESPQEWRPEEGGGLGGHGNGNEHLTPGQTTRFGRISRPPVAVPPQSQLALLQQILQGTGESSNAAPAGHSAPPGSRRQTEVEHGYGSSSNYGHSHSSSRQNVPVSTHPARATAVKRPHSTLRESSIPPRSLSPDLRSRGSSEEPLVRPTPPTHSMGRPRKGDPVPTKEERAQRRRINNQHSAADYRKKKEMYIKSLEDRVQEKERQVKAKAEECEMWRQKCVDMEKQHAVLSALWTAAGYTLPNENGSVPVPSNDRFLPPSLPIQRQTNRPSGVRNVPDTGNIPAMSPAAMNPPIRSPIPLHSANSTPYDYPSPAQPTPMASASTTLAAAMAPSHLPAISPSNHPTLSPHNPYPGSSPVETPDGTPFNLGVDLSAFDDFFNWDIMPDNEVDDQQDADFVPASSPRRDSDSEQEESDGEGHTRKKQKRSGKGKAKSKPKNQSKDTPGEDDDEFVDPEVDEEDLFMPITDVEVPPGQMQLVEKAANEVMSTFGVDSQAQLTGVMQKIVDAGEGLTGEQLEKMKSVLRWMHSSGRLPGSQV